jgi:uncharacterized protein (DUF58 family)
MQVPHELLNIEFLAREVMAGFITGMHSSPYQGFSVEFAEHRSYNPGDSLRHVDWKLLARSDKVFVKKFEEETNLRCQFVVDISPSMLFPGVEEKPDSILSHPNKLQFSLISAAVIMYIFRKQRDAYGLSLFDEEICWHRPPAMSLSHHNLIMKTMDDYLKYSGARERKTRVSKILEELSFQIPPRSMVIIFSDAWEADALHWAKTLSLFKYKKNEVIFFHVYHSRQEKNLEYDSRPVEFRDMESGEKIRLQPQTLKEEYLQKFEQRTRLIQESFQRFGYDFVEADITQGYRAVLETYFRKRKYFL